MTITELGALGSLVSDAVELFEFRLARCEALGTIWLRCLKLGAKTPW